MRCTCSSSVEPCQSCTLRIDDAEGGDWFFDRLIDDGWAVPPGGEPW